MTNKRESTTKFLMALLGAVVYVLSINFFLAPLKLYSGGIMGVSQLIRTLLEGIGFNPGFDFSGIIFYALNVPIIIIAFIYLKKDIVFKTLFLATLTTVLLSVLPVPAAPILDEKIANCLAAGILSGLGIGLVFYGSASLGGLDIISLVVIQKNRNFSAGKISLGLNIMLYSACAILFDINTAIYSVIVAAFCSVIMDKVHYQNIDQEIKIITSNFTEEMKDGIIEGLGRGLTIIEAKGAFTGEERKILLVTVSRYESRKLKALVKEYDPHAFIVENDRVHITGNYKKKL